MRDKLAKRCGAYLAAFFVSSIVPTGAAFAADELKMYIENESGDTLYYETQVGVSTYPLTIDPNTTSSEIDGPHKGGGGDGQITYTNAKNPLEATCSITLGFGYEYNGTTVSCDKKKLEPSVNSGTCTFVKDGDCYGDGSCKCNFTYTSAATQ